MRRNSTSPYHLSDEELRSASTTMLHTLNDLAIRALSRAIREKSNVSEIRYLQKRVELEIDAREWEAREVEFAQLTLPPLDIEIMMHGKCVGAFA